MKDLKALLPYAWRYRTYLFSGFLFVFLSNYFNVLSPQLTSFVIDHVQRVLQLPGYKEAPTRPMYNWLVDAIITGIQKNTHQLTGVVALCGLTLLVLALLRGLFLFFMRQTIIVMSRHIEYAQKNEIYQHYQQLDSTFFKVNRTGDLMNRITEDVSRVRTFTGPAVMYIANLISIISLCVYFMLRRDPTLTLYVLLPLPVLAILIYHINNSINKRSETIQDLLSALTTHAQESYAGIRVIKSFIQERSLLTFYKKLSNQYRAEVLGLVKVEALYFPSISLLIGVSTLLTIMIGGLYYIQGDQAIGVNTIVEFVMYINMLTFPVSAIGLTASMIQRAAASQKRINEFLKYSPVQQSQGTASPLSPFQTISWQGVSYTYPDSGILAIQQLTVTIQKGEHVLIVGKTGSGKTTLLQLLLRFYQPDSGELTIDGRQISQFNLQAYRSQMGYVSQDVFLFSDTIANNISFGVKQASSSQIEWAAKVAAVDEEIRQFSDGYQTVVGERGVTLSGGQKQRLSMARAFLHQPEILLLDDCLSAVDSQTEQRIASYLNTAFSGKTLVLASHRIPAHLRIDKVIVLDEGRLIEIGEPSLLLSRESVFKKMLEQQNRKENAELSEI
jgi:ATP-binding cassette subfamily B multidrug efflux pump